ncbi:anti-sigma factor antagonist [bacterium]|nr:MAG: anti-sigma factor antagonist [bacterium]
MNAIAEDITIVKELKIEHAAAPVGDKDVHILRLEGYVDAHTFAEFEEELTRLTDKENQFNLLLDLEKLTYINSTGLGLLMATFRQVRQHNGDLVIAKMSDKITNIFNLLGFSRLIHTYPSEQEALARFAPS